MYGILGEDDSDAAALKILIRGLVNDPHLRVLAKGFSGGGELLRSGSRQLAAFADQGCNRFVVCHDADGPDASIKRQEIEKRVIEPAKGIGEWCVVVPVEELEAWILADIEAVTNVFPGWVPTLIKGNPEGIRNPKERLRRESRNQNKKPRYDPATHNQQVAKYLRLDILRKRCPSFEHLAKFVTG